MPQFTGSGAFMTAPAQPTTKPYDPDPSCPSLIDPGFTGGCSQATTPTGTLAAVTEQQQGTSGGEARDLLYRREGDTWSLALRHSEHVDQSTGSLDSSTLVDIAADGDSKAVFVQHDAGTDSAGGVATVHQLDVAEATGQVVLHLSLDHGFARGATGGGVEAWSRLTGTSPLEYRHFVVRYTKGAWRAEVDEQVPAESVPQPDAKGSDPMF